MLSFNIASTSTNPDRYHAHMMRQVQCLTDSQRKELDWLEQSKDPHTGIGLQDKSLCHTIYGRVISRLVDVCHLKGGYKSRSFAQYQPPFLAVC